MPGAALRVAVVGAGPSGLYAVQALLKRREHVAVDVFEALPAPFGLVRYGVAPDHPRTQSVSRALSRVFDDPRVRFVGNTTLGTNVSREELLATHHALVHATGAPHDRSLNIPGEDLAGNWGSADIVSWYCGHPHARPVDLSATRSVVIVGGGNVALDIARMLLRKPVELAATDIPSTVLQTFEKSQVTTVHLVVRRGPNEAKFSSVELRELLELRGVDVVNGMGRDQETAVSSDSSILNVSLLQAAGRQPGAERSVVFHWHTTPTRLRGTDRVSEVELVGPGGPFAIETGLVVRAIGHRGAPVDGLPFAPASGTVPHRQGQVLESEREFVVGWLKRGASGVIGTNKADAVETVDALLSCATSLSAHAGAASSPPAPMPGSTTWQQWKRIDAAELDHHTGRPTERVKIARLGTMLDIAAAREPADS